MFKLLSKLIRPKIPHFTTRGNKLPTSWNEVPIKELQELDKIQANFESSHNWVRRNIKTIQLFGGETTGKTIGELAKTIKQMPFLSEPPSTSFPPKFYLNGKLYICLANIKEAAAWAAISISNYAEAGSEKNMHYIAACLVWEKAEKHPESTIEARAQYFLNHLPASVLHGLCAFFLNNSMVLSVATRNYLAEKIKREKQKTGL
jgi:hypothetical protein